MPVWLISFFFAVGVTGFVYAKLVKMNGNPSVQRDLIGAGVAGVMIYIVVFTLLKFVFNF